MEHEHDFNTEIIPLLRVENVPHSYTDFANYAQDMLGSEFYVGAFKDGPTWRSNKFADVSSIDKESNDISMVPNFNTKSLSCLVKIYDSLEIYLKLNDVVAFVGVFTFDPELVVHKTDSDKLIDGLCDEALADLPPTKVPRLHSLIHRKLALQDFLFGSHDTEPKPSLIRGIQETLLRHLTSILGNDGVVAQCMVLHLLSRVQARVDSIVVGKLSLNLCGINVESVAIFVSQLNLVIQSILPFSQCIPLTMEYQHRATLVPRTYYQSNRLITGALHLVRGSHLTFGETRLISGTLNFVGVANMRLLKNLMECKQVEYEFDYYKTEMPAYVQFLILSIGKSSILPTDLVLPFQPNNILSKWIPIAERSRSLALAYSGMYLCSVTGLAFSPFLLHKFGWPSVFYSFGSLGTVWFAAWLRMPTYYNQVLKFNLTEYGLFCVLPRLTLALATNVGGWIADTLSGVFGTALTGYILQHGSWDDVFKVSVGLYLVGTMSWNLFSTSVKILA
ncbi:mini-chromosome maintenance complex-binding protein-like [Aristolochia californica]|uniref:mini-chromosome maintenance complex-binding protein-like n=1 Tax=Aristolochia californica TaxID=171875 RepID=UPI0035DEC3CC